MNLARELVFGQTAGVTEPSEFTARSTKLPRHTSSLGGDGAWVARGSRVSDEEQAGSRDASLQEPLLAAGNERDVERGAWHAHAADNQPQPSEEAETPTNAEAFSRRVRIGINASWAVNILLLVSKVVVFFLSSSYAVLASAIDSLVDLLSQAVLAVAEYQVSRFDERYPIGRTRMAELSVLCCAVIMFVSTALVIREATGALWEGFHGSLPSVDLSVTLFAVLGSASAFKLALYIYCRALRRNPIMVALAEDHLNDVMSNVAAIAGASAAGYLPRYWWVDGGMAILFSLLIIRNWVMICWEQGEKMIGLGAPDELVSTVSTMVDEHHPDMKLDRVTAYHHGSHMVVEVEVILPGDMTVTESHDIALALQHKIEAVEDVERAYVHVDYARRSLEEHKVERNLKLGEKDVMKPLASMDSDSATPHLARALSSNVSLAAPGAGAGAGAARSPTEHNEGGCAGLGSPGGSCGAAPERSCCSGAGSGSGSGRGRSAGGGRSSGDAAGAGTSSGEGAGAEVEEQEVVEGAV